MNSAEKSGAEYKYLIVNERDKKYGSWVNTVGYQSVPPQAKYPPTGHPQTYRFTPQAGRVLSEYQLIYITRGQGYFSSRSCPLQQIKAGTVMLLFPGEWHSYYPDPATGWDEYWLGFKGANIDHLANSSFFTPQHPVYNFGIHKLLINMYEDTLQIAAQERRGCQQILSGITQHMLGIIYYKEQNCAFDHSQIVDKINEAKVLLKDMDNLSRTVEEIAAEIGVGYSRFRKAFKEYTGISPAQYQQQQRLFKAKEMLTNTLLNINEISDALRFECACQFSSFFHRYEGMSPTEFRKKIH